MKLLGSTPDAYLVVMTAEEAGALSDEIYEHAWFANIQGAEELWLLTPEELAHALGAENIWDLPQHSFNAHRGPLHPQLPFGVELEKEGAVSDTQVDARVERAGPRL